LAAATLRYGGRQVPTRKTFEKTYTFIRELQRSYRWRAKREFGLSSVDDAFTGMVTVIQRFDSALRLNVHFHTLVLDGVYVKSENGEGLRFLRLPRPSEEDVYQVAMGTAKKVQAYLEKRGRTSDSESNGEEGSVIEAALGSCYDVAAQAPKKQIVDRPRMGKGEWARKNAWFAIRSLGVWGRRERRPWPQAKGGQRPKPPIENKASRSGACAA
jgi:Putative transposase